jgi:Fur family ferric uptake transcriptional regulator
MTTPIEVQFRAKGLRLTKQGRLIVEAISEANGYPDFAELYQRAAERNRRVSRATVYRALRCSRAKASSPLYVLFRREDLGNGEARSPAQEGAPS